MGYRDQSNIRLDISSAGRGVQQTLLLLAYLLANPASVILLDEPDAHLEILRQRQVYHQITSLAEEQRSQIIAASHSEVVLNEAADRHVVVAFVGNPHRIDGRGSHLAKALRQIGFEDYYLAEQRGWVLYLEGSTDLEILKRFAGRLNHPASQALDAPFVVYVENQPQKARDHFFGLLEGKPDLVGFLLCDRLERQLQPTPALTERMWTRREIENYVCAPEALQAYAVHLARQSSPGPLFDDALRFEGAMQECVQALAPPVALRDAADPYWRNAKASDEFLDRVFEMFFRKIGLPNLMRKSNYHELAAFVPANGIDPEVTVVLDEILRVSQRAQPVVEC